MENKIKNDTPLSYLNALCRKKGFTPQYELVGQEGRTHEPLFTFNCCVADLMTRGEGTNKKKAKQIAAQNMLISINNLKEDHVLVDLKEHVTDLETKFKFLHHCNSSDDITKNDLQADLEEGFKNKSTSSIENVNNPIGELLEICLLNSIQPPIYELVEAHGMSHERMFVYEASILKYQARGEGKSKKMAKRLAALQLLSVIKENMNDLKTQSSVPVEGNDDKEPQIFHKKEMDMHLDESNSFYKNLCMTEETQASTQYIELMNPKSALNSLKDMDLNSSSLLFEQAKSLLELISKEQGFKIDYREHFNQNNQNYSYIEYVELSTTPPLCTAAIGKSNQVALENCVKNTLKFLKTILYTIPLLQQKRLLIQNYMNSSEAYKKYYSTDSFGPDIKEIAIEELLKNQLA